MYSFEEIIHELFTNKNTVEDVSDLRNKIIDIVDKHANLRKKDLQPKYITNILSGGLGNQMFMIAATYSIAVDLNVEYRQMFKQFYGCPQGYSPEHYLKSVYSKINFTDEEIPSEAETIYERFWYYHGNKIVDETRVLLANSGKASIQGYRQSDQYFKHNRAAIRDLFTPSGGWRNWLLLNEPGICEKYNDLFKDSHGYCFIGVRRGDYLTPLNRARHNPCEMDYYTKAMNMLPAERYYIASDDIEWCRANFVGEQFYFFDLKLEQDYIQLGLMTLFQKFIIANSTFNWWGSYLSEYDEDVLVVAPDKWIFGTAAEQQYKSIYRDEMLIVNRSIETTSDFTPGNERP